MKIENVKNLSQRNKTEAEPVFSRLSSRKCSKAHIIFILLS